MEGAYDPGVPGGGAYALGGAPNATEGRWPGFPSAARSDCGLGMVVVMEGWKVWGEVGVGKVLERLENDNQENGIGREGGAR